MDAQRAGLQATHEGRLRARLTKGDASIDVKIELWLQMMPGAISVPHGWGHDLLGARLVLAVELSGVNLSALFDETAAKPPRSAVAE